MATISPGDSTPIDIFSDELLTLKEAASRLPKRPHAMTVHRWAMRGIRGGTVRLQTVVVSNERYTTVDAMRAFIVQSSVPPEQRSSTSTTRQRKNASSR